MSFFYLKSGDKLIEVTERSWSSTPPLSHFCRVGAEVASLITTKAQQDLSSFIYDILRGLILNGHALKNQYCYAKIIEAISNLMLGSESLCRRSLIDAFNADPANIFAISLLSDLEKNNKSIKVWAESRINEILIWHCNEDILIIGDSHAYSFNGIARCRTCYIASHTMHHIGNNGVSFSKYNHPDLSSFKTVAVCFGEIDARVHIAKQSNKQSLSIKQIINDIVDRYMLKIDSTRKEYSLSSIIIIGVVPPIKESMSKQGWTYGSDIDRLLIHKELNAYILQQCGVFGFDFLDMNAGFADNDGFISHDFWAGDHHISAMHYQELERRLMKAIDRSNEIT